MKRHYRRITCSNPDCQRLHRTSSPQRGHLCAACQRAAHAAKCLDQSQGIYGYDRRISTLNVRPVPVLSFGKCGGPCGRKDQELANGWCSECRFWNGPDTDQEMSARARHSAPVQFRNYRTRTK